MKVLALMSIPAPIKDQIAALPNVQIEGPDYLAQHGLTDITAIFGWQSRLNDLIKENSTVRFVQSFSAGVDYFPLATFQEKNIVMANTSGIHARPIAESVLAYVLAFARGIADSAHRTPENFWDRDASRGDVFTLPGKTALIYGTGHIGRAIAEILTQQGMTVTGISHHGEAVAPFTAVGTDQDSAAFAKAADVIINIMPLTPETHHFFNAAFFNALTKKPLFINVGRGPSVDTGALVAALQTNQLSGAALDVFEQEPLPATSPLWQAPHLLMTPHVSGAFAEIYTAAATILYHNLAQFIRDGSLAENQVDLSQGY